MRNSVSVWSRLTRWGFALWLALSVFAPAQAQVQAQAQSLQLAIGDWPPYTSATDKDAKLLERVVSEAFKLEGVEVRFSYSPWARAYMYAKSGESAGTFPWNRTPERERDLYFNSIPIMHDKSVFFHLKSTRFDWKELDDLKHYRLGVTLGFQQAKFYADHGINADLASSEELNFRKLFAGRIEVYETSEIVGYRTLRRIFSEADARQFTHHPVPREENVYYIGFTRNEQGKLWAARFDSGMRKLIESGAYAKLMAELTPH